MQNSSNTSSNLKLAILLAMTMALGPLALDTYLPAFPNMAESLSVTVHEISLSISIYVFVLSFGQLVAGPLSDRFGRAIVMLGGLSLFGIASLLIMQVKDINSLLILRALQAFGGGWAMVCVPALVRDKLSGQEAAKFFSLIGLIMVAAPALAPSIGSVLLQAFDWTSIFLFLGVYALLMAISLKILVFNQDYRKPAAQAHTGVWQRYKSVFKQRSALRFMLLQALAFSVMMLFITHSSFIYQAHFAATPTAFALYFGANIIAMLGVNLLNRQLLNYFAPQRILRWALTMQAIGIVLLILVMSFAPYLWLFLPAMMITIGAMGAVSPNIQACYMESFPQNSGTAAAVLGASQFSVAGLISAGSTLLPQSVMAIVLTQALFSLLCLMLIWNKGYQQQVK